jgi:hypothetical protein
MMAIYLPCRKNIHSLEYAHMFFEHVISKHGIRANIVTDHGTPFTSRFWTPVCFHMIFYHRLSIGCHTQTEGLTNQQNQTMEKYL